jgi:signal transduction histidine kinase
MVSIASEGPVGLQRLSALWQETIEYFVPGEMVRDRELHNRARMFLISHLLGPILGNSALAALYVFDPTPQWDLAVIAVSITAFWLFPFLLRRGVSYDRLVLCSVANLNFNVLLSCYFNGGVASPTMPWVLIIPMLSLFYLGGEQRLQPRLLGVTAGSFTIFFLAFHLYPPEPNDIPDAAMVGLGAVSNIATLCYVAMMAIYYARIFDAGVDLEIEVRRRQQMAEELRQAILAAHRVGSAKAEFLARMSHEIRTPLNAIIGYGEILREEAAASGDREKLDDLDRILDAARYLVRLINLILDLAKIDAGRMSFDARPHDVREMLAAAAEQRRALVEEHGNRISITVEPGLDSIVVDRHRLLQILDGVIENAARHTRGGRIALSASRAAAPRESASRAAAPGDAVRIAISDTGSGISPDTLDTLFESFTTARTAAVEGRYGGTGLSLTVFAQLCRLMGGRIEATSAPGRGSTFTITLPLPMHGPASDPAGPGQPGASAPARSDTDHLPDRCRTEHEGRSFTRHSHM